jgi:hypothetical protein
MHDEPKRIFRVASLADYRRELFENWPTDWPRKENHAVQHDVSVDQYKAFSKLIGRSAGETEIESYLAKNHEVLAMTISMFSTGHHMSWIFPKEQIRPSSGPTGGLIPDYLLAGANSFGVEWFVLELKGADKRAFTKRGKRTLLSADANKGVCQLLNYIDRSSHDQAFLSGLLPVRLTPA